MGRGTVAGGPGPFDLAYDRIDARALSTTGAPMSGTVSRARIVLHAWKPEREGLAWSDPVVMVVGLAREHQSG